MLFRSREDESGARGGGQLGDGGVLVAVAGRGDEGRPSVDLDFRLAELCGKAAFLGRCRCGAATREGERVVGAEVLGVLLRELGRVRREDVHDRLVVLLEDSGDPGRQAGQDHETGRVARHVLEALGALRPTRCPREQVREDDDELPKRLVGVRVDVAREAVELALEGAVSGGAAVAPAKSLTERRRATSAKFDGSNA